MYFMTSNCCHFTCSSIVLFVPGFKILSLHDPSSCKNLIDLRKHLDTHSKEPAYRCEFEACDFSARSLCSIKLHYKKVHEVRREQTGVREPGAVSDFKEKSRAAITEALQKDS